MDLCNVMKQIEQNISKNPFDYFENCAGSIAKDGDTLAAIMATKDGLVDLHIAKCGKTVIHITYDCVSNAYSNHVGIEHINTVQWDNLIKHISSPCTLQ